MNNYNVPKGWKLVPEEPTEEMWGGLARDLMMWLDFENKTVEALRRHLAMLNVEWPKWMDDEDELKGSGVPSKGTRATLIYKAMLAAAPDLASTGKFAIGSRVRKIKGSRWQGRVVGTYSTELTPEGYAVESETEHGSVQIYPAHALELVGDK